MQIREYAEIVLFGSSLADKLMDPLKQGGEFVDESGAQTMFQEPEFPGRPVSLLNTGQQELPKSAELESAHAWAQMLHFFANHELLAIELMALSLLKFPDTPSTYRIGVAHTIREEQQHLQMYLSRLSQLGYEFGDFAVNDFFWRRIRQAQSPLEFVALMNMTFEQANLDYSLHYQGIAERLGDNSSAAIFKQIHLDEIRHVGHGVKWFNTWRSEAGDLRSDWQAFLQLLPPGTSPRRARGIGFCAESRIEAGLSNEFVEELSVCGGSLGRPSELFFFNPEVDFERVKKGDSTQLYRTSCGRAVKELILDLECLPLFLARESDVLLVQQKPSLDWLKHLKRNGIPLPEILEWDFADFESLEALARKWSGIQPWGISSALLNHAKPVLQQSLGSYGKWLNSLSQESALKLGSLGSKTFCNSWYNNWRQSHPGTAECLENDYNSCSFSDIALIEDYILERIQLHKLLCKAPFGSSGQMSRRIDNYNQYNEIKPWIESVLEQQGSMLVEEYCQRVADFAFQLEITADQVRILDQQQFFVGKGLQYRGTWLGPKFAHLKPEQTRWLHEKRDSRSAPLQIWKELVLDLARDLQRSGYQGPASVDGFLYQNSAGLQLRPICEVNLRFSMGQIARCLRFFVQPGQAAIWLHVPLRKIKEKFGSVEGLLSFLEDSYPDSYMLTSDPLRARRTLSILIKGRRDEAVAFTKLLFDQEIQLLK